MDDRLDPRFAAAVRARLLEQVRAPAPRRASTGRPPRRSRWQPVLALGIAAITVVSIIVGVTVAAQTRTTSAPASPPFDGDCAVVLTARGATSLIGKPMTLRPTASVLDSPDRLAVAAVGGLDCSWSGDGTIADETGIELTVLPVALRPEDAKAGRLCFGSNDGEDFQNTCVVDVVAGGRWFTGFLTGRTRADGGGTTAQVRALVARLDDTIRALPAADDARPLDRAGWWRPVRCERLAEEADLPAVLGHPDLDTGVGNGGMRSEGAGAATGVAVAANCLAEAATDTDDPFDLELHVTSGAGAIVREQLEGPGVHRLADVDGAEVYRVVSDTADTSVLWVVAAGGAYELSPARGDADAVRPAIAPILKALDAHRRP